MRPPVSTSAVEDCASPRRRATSALPASVGHPLPRSECIVITREVLPDSLHAAPPEPSLLVLKDALTGVLSERDKPHNDNVGRDGMVLTPTDPEGVVNNPDDGANEQTPCAEHPEELPTALIDFEQGDDDDGFDFELPKRPETLTPSLRSKRPSDLLLVGTDDTENAVAGPSNLGRTPACVNTILDQSFHDINLQISQLASRIGLPFQQVINRFMKQYSHTCVNNHWNTYQKFHTANKEQELARLGNTDLTTSTPGTCCFWQREHEALTCVVSAYHENVLHIVSERISRYMAKHLRDFRGCRSFHRRGQIACTQTGPFPAAIKTLLSSSACILLSLIMY